MSKLFKIFVSSTFNDLQEERHMIFEAIIRRKCFPVGMEYFPPLTRKSLRYIYELIDGCDFFLLLLGGRYGNSLDEHGTSFTELEYQYARGKNVPVIPLIMEDWRRAPMVADEINKTNMLSKFIETVKKDFDGWKPWTKSNLMLLVSEAVEQAIKDNPKAIGWIRADNLTLISNHEDSAHNMNSSVIGNREQINQGVNLDLDVLEGAVYQEVGNSKAYISLHIRILNNSERQLIIGSLTVSMDGLVGAFIEKSISVFAMHNGMGANHMLGGAKPSFPTTIAADSFIEHYFTFVFSDLTITPSKEVSIDVVTTRGSQKFTRIVTMKI